MRREDYTEDPSTSTSTSILVERDCTDLNSLAMEGGHRAWEHLQPNIYSLPRYVQSQIVKGIHLEPEIVLTFARREEAVECTEDYVIRVDVCIIFH